MINKYLNLFLSSFSKILFLLSVILFSWAQVLLTLQLWMRQLENGEIIQFVVFAVIACISTFLFYFLFKPVVVPQNVEVVSFDTSLEKNLKEINFQNLGLNFAIGLYEGFTKDKKH